MVVCAHSGCRNTSSPICASHCCAHHCASSDCTRHFPNELSEEQRKEQQRLREEHQRLIEQQRRKSAAEAAEMEEERVRREEEALIELQRKKLEFSIRRAGARQDARTLARKRYSQCVPSMGAAGTSRDPFRSSHPLVHSTERSDPLLPLRLRGVDTRKFDHEKGTYSDKNPIAIDILIRKVEDYEGMKVAAAIPLSGPDCYVPGIKESNPLFHYYFELSEYDAEREFDPWEILTKQIDNPSLPWSSRYGSPVFDGLAAIELGNQDRAFRESDKASGNEEYFVGRLTSKKILKDLLAKRCWSADLHALLPEHMQIELETVFTCWSILNTRPPAIAGTKRPASSVPGLFAAKTPHVRRKLGNLSVSEIRALTVNKLKNELRVRGAATDGLKQVLHDRLLELLGHGVSVKTSDHATDDQAGVHFGHLPPDVVHIIMSNLLSAHGWCMENLGSIAMDVDLKACNSGSLQLDEWGARPATKVDKKVAAKAGVTFSPREVGVAFSEELALQADEAESTEGSDDLAKPTLEDNDADIFLSAVADYVVRELCDISGRAAQKLKRASGTGSKNAIIRPPHVRLAIKFDEEFAALFGQGPEEDASGGDEGFEEDFTEKGQSDSDEEVIRQEESYLVSESAFALDTVILPSVRRVHNDEFFAAHILSLRRDPNWIDRAPANCDDSCYGNEIDHLEEFDDLYAKAWDLQAEALSERGVQLSDSLPEDVIPMKNYLLCLDDDDYMNGDDSRDEDGDPKYSYEAFRYSPRDFYNTGVVDYGQKDYFRGLLSKAVFPKGIDGGLLVRYESSLDPPLKELFPAFDKNSKFLNQLLAGLRYPERGGNLFEVQLCRRADVPEELHHELKTFDGGFQYRELLERGKRDPDLGPLSTLDSLYLPSIRKCSKELKELFLLTFRKEEERVWRPWRKAQERRARRQQTRVQAQYAAQERNRARKRYERGESSYDPDEHEPPEYYGYDGFDSCASSYDEW